MKPSDVLEYLKEYEKIESWLLEIAEYVPLDPNPSAPNYCFPSPKAAEFALECGTWLETLMTELLMDDRLDDIQRIHNLRRYPNIDTYRKVFEARFGFSKGGWALKGQNEPQILPF